MLQKGWIIQRFDCELRYAIVGIRTKGAVTIGLLRESIIFRCSNYVVAGLRYSITRVKLACYLSTTVLYRIDRHLHIGLLYYLASWKVWTWLYIFSFINFLYYMFSRIKSLFIQGETDVVCCSKPNFRLLDGKVVSIFQHRLYNLQRIHSFFYH